MCVHMFKHSPIARKSSRSSRKKQEGEILGTLEGATQELHPPYLLG